MALVIQVPQNLKTIKNINIQHVIEQVSIVDLVLEAGVDLIEQTGGDYICLCPFHDDRETPSMRIYTETNTWHCFGCDKGSSIFDFTMFQDGIDFQEALQICAVRAGYTGAYVLKKVNIDIKSEKFSVARDEIEVALFQKYIKLLREKKKSHKLNSSVYKEINEFWEWYDNCQILVDRKVWQGIDLELLDRKLYEFYGKALNKLNNLNKGQEDEQATSKQSQ